MAADIEALLCPWLTAKTLYIAAAELPPGFPGEEEPITPMTLVTEIGGPGQRVPGLDRCDVHIESFGPDRETARALAELTRDLVMYQLPAELFDDGKTTFSKVETTSKPSRLPYGGGVYRYLAAYYMTVHSRA